MRFEFEAAKELWNGRINHERVKNVDVITNKDTCPLGIKARRAMDFKSHSAETQNIAEENALRQVILSRIYKNREKKKECADAVSYTHLDVYKRQILEQALGADYAFIRAYRADHMGNLIYHKAARNFNPIMATAAKFTIAEVEEIVGTGKLDPETIITPSIFVDRIVQAEGKRYA